MTKPSYNPKLFVKPMANYFSKYLLHSVLDSVKPSHISDLIGELDSDQLSNVYEQLDIEHKYVKKAHERANTTDPDQKAKEVFRFWKDQNGKKATRTKLLKALEKCKYMNAMENLQEMWASSQ